jgi:hypothetical protein
MSITSTIALVALTGGQMCILAYLDAIIRRNTCLGRGRCVCARVHRTVESAKADVKDKIGHCT